MAYTVKKLATLSGVSVRTLHWYDEVGLLKPAYHGANGYRYYDEAQLLTLQQILFYRELGFELKEIKRILSRTGFDRVAALESHRRVLRKNLAHTQQLLETIDKTIRHLKGTATMKAQEMFSGFSPEQQEKHEQYLINRFGDGAREGIAESKQRVKNWGKAQWEKSGEAFAQICQDFVQLIDAGAKEDSADAQAIARRQYEWLKQFWTPTRESYTGYAALIEDSELRGAVEKYHPELPKYMASAIRTFAKRELT